MADEPDFHSRLSFLEEGYAWLLNHLNVVRPAPADPAPEPTPEHPADNPQS